MTGFPKVDVIPCPFAQDDVRRTHIITGPSNTEINFKTAIPPGFSVPASNGGSRFSRHMMNQLGYLSTLGAYLDQMGYAHTFNKSFCAEIGGYPKGTILKHITYKEDADGEMIPDRVRDVISMQEDNTVDFVEDPSVIDNEVDGVVWWKYVKHDVIYGSWIPDYENAELILYKTVGTNETYKSPAIMFNESGWLFLKVHINGFKNIATKYYSNPGVSIMSSEFARTNRFTDSSYVGFPITKYQGESINTLSPVGAGTSFVIQANAGAASFGDEQYNVSLTLYAYWVGRKLT